ncbi:MAG: dodecin family protein [Chitinophagaceae bacterium]
MAIVKVIEVIASSEKSFDDALKQAVQETSKTIRNIDSVWVKDMKAHVKDGEIKSYGVICKVSFRVDNDDDEKKGKKKKNDKDS